MTILETRQNETHKIEIHADYDCESPRSMYEEVGTFIVWSRDLVSPDKNDYNDREEFLRAWNGEWQVVSAADGSLWADGYLTETDALEDAAEGYVVERVSEGIGVGGVALDISSHDYGSNGTSYSCSAFDPTDDSANGVIFCTADKVQEEWSGDKEKAENYLRGEVETYAQWASGAAFGYVAYQKLQVHYRAVAPNGVPTEWEGEEWEETDSCWGFLGYENYKDALCDLPEEYNELIESL